MPLRLFGVAVNETDARALVATLVSDGAPDALSAAEVVSRALDLGLVAVALSLEQREAILDVLQEPEGSLAELRGALFRDFEQRRRAEE